MPSENDNQIENQILIVAAEASSTLYAQRLLELWKSQGKKIHALGVGSREMESLGFEIIGRSEEMAVVGFQEILAHYLDIRKVFYKILEQAKSRKIKFALLLDYPGFNLKLAKELSLAGIKVVYYISPQVWAWKKSRIKDIKKYVHKMLVVFPFEKEFYQQHDVDVEFVGHPLLDELSADLFDKAKIATLRNRYGVQSTEPVLGLMPGSRRSELKYNLLTQLQVAETLHKNNQNLKVALLVAPTFSVEEIKSLLPEYKFPLMLIKDDPNRMIAICDHILCASGTATMMVGLMEKPLVIMYKMNSFSAFLAKKLVTTTPYFGMVNLILNKRVAPEFFQEEASVSNLSRQMESLMYETKVRDEMVNQLKQLRNLLGSSGATKKVAQCLEAYL